MNIQMKPSAVKQTKWYEYVIRFVFGGLITMAAGFVAKMYGPVIGGLFLAFPSIFPASLTLVQTHKERQAKKQGESKETQQEEGLQAAQATSLGTILGSSGLAAFALILWGFSPALPPAVVLALAFLTWLVVCVAVWWLYGKISGKQRSMLDERKNDTDG